MTIQDFYWFCERMMGIGAVVVFAGLFLAARTIGESYEDRGRRP